MGEEASREQSSWNREMKVTTNLSLNIDKHQGDLLKGFNFMSENGDKRAIHHGEEETNSEDETAIELNLGLSLGGRFGVDKTTQRKLKRSSSVLGTVPFNEPENNYTAGLARTTSLPAEMEEEWRKRKEMQSLRRMEAKRRRCEKQQSFRNDQTVSFENERWVLQRPLGSSNRQQVCFDSNGGVGGSSSSLSELNQQGSSNSCNDERSPRSNGTEKQSSSNKVIDKGKDTTGLLDMPCVFYSGPNGKRVDGILYKYGKGEEVRIMCICHGSFLTPAEFVKHGGGGDVDRPLRHIVVNTSSSTF